MKRFNIFALLIACLLITLSLSPVYANHHDSTVHNEGVGVKTQNMCTHCGEQAKFVNIEKVLLNDNTYYMHILECTDANCGETSNVLYVY